MAEKAGKAAQVVREEATALAHTLLEEAAARAAPAAERAKEVGSTLASGALGKVPTVSQKVSDEVIPSLRDVAMQAASAALELWQAARDKAAEAAQTDVADPAAPLVGTAERTARKARETIAGRAEAASGRAKEATAQAAETTVATSKDATAALFWAGAAAAIVFYVILSRERREQLLRYLDTTIRQVRELVRDFQGYDEEFA
jgi:hypothetical protein